MESFGQTQTRSQAAKLFPKPLRRHRPSETPDKERRLQKLDRLPAGVASQSSATVPHCSQGQTEVHATIPSPSQVGSRRGRCLVVDFVLGWRGSVSPAPIVDAQSERVTSTCPVGRNILHQQASALACPETQPERQQVEQQRPGRLFRRCDQPNLAASAKDRPTVKAQDSRLSIVRHIAQMGDTRTADNN